MQGSIGINQSCDVKPSDHYQALYAMKTFPSLDIVKNAIRRKKSSKVLTIGIMGTSFRDFVSKWLPQIDFSFVLVINGCDLDFPTHYFENEKKFYQFIEHVNIKHVCAQNCVITHPKITRLPIGLDYHTLANGATSWGPCQTPYEQERVLIKLQKAAKPFWERKPLCYSNFHFFFGPSHGGDRRDALAKLNKEIVLYEPCSKPRLASWRTQTEYAFVLSPHGNGLDCHRTWEALNLGCIAIVKRSPIDQLYDDLPVLIVNCWSEINVTLLKNTIDTFKNKTFNYRKLELQYWKDKIRSFCSEK